MTIKRNKRKVRTGKVTSDSGDKTIAIQIERLVRHPLYGKVIKRRSKLIVHDEQNAAHVGDLIEVMETRPISKLKRWRLVKILERAK